MTATPRITCQCGARYRFDDSAIGKKGKCKACGAVLTMQPDEEGPIPIAAAPDMANEISAALQRAAAPVPKARHPAESTPANICPSCNGRLAPAAKICVDCGIDIRTGRSLLTSEERNLDELYVVTEGVIKWVSYFVPSGLFPIASEAVGGRRPYAAWSIGLLTVVISLWFLGHVWTDSPAMPELANLMLWAGDKESVTPAIDGEFGDDADFSLSSRPQGAFRASQLLTYAFLHGGLVHLASNLVFLLVFGSRINAVFGNIMTLALYAAFAAAGGISHLVSMIGDSPAPLLGASGAIMGLAGLYFVLFPLPKVHTVIWLRIWFPPEAVAGTIFSPRGFYIVLFYIAFDVISVAVGFVDQVAHWAHLGGFIAGVVVGLTFLSARLVNTQGCDIVSATLGKRAWALVGRPSREIRFLQRVP